MIDKKIFVTKPGIVINELGNWYYQGIPIENDAILTYFKKQLRREKKRYYIENIFGKRKEHAYLDTVIGYPLMVTKITPIAASEGGAQFDFHISLDSKEIFTLGLIDLRILTSETMVILLGQRGDVPARLNPAAMYSLAPYLRQNSKDEYFLVLSETPEEQEFSANQELKLCRAKEEDFLQTKLETN